MVSQRGINFGQNSVNLVVIGPNASMSIYISVGFNHHANKCGPIVGLNFPKQVGIELGILFRPLLTLGTRATYNRDFFRKSNINHSNKG
jgi:hypothetical protein